MQLTSTCKLQPFDFHAFEKLPEESENLFFFFTFKPQELEAPKSVQNLENQTRSSRRFEALFSQMLLWVSPLELAARPHKEP